MFYPLKVGFMVAVRLTVAALKLLLNIGILFLHSIIAIL